MKKLLILLVALFIVSFFESCTKDDTGCTDPLSLNYNPNALTDDGSCKYPDVFIIDKDITSTTVITEKNIKICDEIKVSAGLVIPSGAIVTMCAGAGLEIRETGYLKAVGTANEPIVFQGEDHFAGYWVGLSFESNNPNNILSFTTVKDAGSYWYNEFAGVFVTGKLSIDNSTITNNQDVGLYFGKDAQIGTYINNTISNNITGLSLKGNLISKLDSESKYINNTNNYIHARSFVAKTNAVWQKMSVPIYLEEMHLEAGLTINAGNHILMEAGNDGIEVRNTGYLNCAGTVTDPINIVGFASAPGFWEGIRIRSNNPNNILNYTTISDGGSYWYYEYANILVEGSLVLNNSTISNADSYGIYVDKDGRISSNGAIQTDLAGLEINNSFLNNGNGAHADCTNGCKVFFE